MIQKPALLQAHADFLREIAGYDQIFWTHGQTAPMFLKVASAKPQLVEPRRFWQPPTAGAKIRERSKNLVITGNLARKV